MNRFLFAFLLCTVLNADGFLGDSKKGWFWGEEPPVKVTDNNITKNKEPKEVKNKIKFKNKEYKKIANEVDIPFQILNELDPDEINKIEVENRKISLMYPTTDNITQYKLLQYYITKKAKGFASASSDVMRKNAVLANWVGSIPTKHITLQTDAKEKENKSLQTIQSFKDKVIILVAMEPDCPYCIKQAPILDKFVDIYKVQYKNVDISINKGFGQKYQVERTPTMFLLYDNNGNPEITRIATGLQAMNNIEEAVLIGLYTFKLINKDLL